MGVKLQFAAWYQVCSAFPSGLFGRMLQSYPPRDEGRGFDVSGTGSPHHSPQIMIEVESVQAEVDIALPEERTRAGTH
jgi:hypothetical protein